MWIVWNYLFMQQLFNQYSQQLYQFYLKAEQFVDEQRQFSVSEKFINATLERFVTDNVGMVKDLHLDLHDHWLRLYTTIDYAGNHFELSVDLKLVKMHINHEEQLFVFEQISDTQVIQATFKPFWYKWLAYGALFYYQDIKRHDPLGMILQRFNIGVTEKNGLLHLDLMRWFHDSPSVLNTLKKVNVYHGTLQEKQLIVDGQLFLDEIVQLKSKFTRDNAPVEPVPSSDECAETDILVTTVTA